MTLFRLDASIRTEGSVTRAVADTVQAAWTAEHPDAPVVRRDVGTAPLPAEAWRTAVSNAWTPPEREPATTAGRPGVLVLARGGGYAPGTPREGWDHASPWIRRILGDVLGLELEVVEAELTLAPVTPSMSGLRDLAAASLAAAHRSARTGGSALGRRVAGAAA